jgi:hypothetical protein
MSRLLALLSLVAVGMSARADPPAAEGTIDVDGARVEVLGRAVPVGARVELPEGWFRVEEQGVEDRQAGSFSVLSAAAASGAPAKAAPEIARAAVEAEPPPPPPPPPPVPTALRCRAERAEYLRELWRETGVEVDHPDAVLEGLDPAHGGAALGPWEFGPGGDPIRPLAWSSELRDRARDLARCVREAEPR